MSSQFPQGPPPDPAFLAQSRAPEILFGTLFPFFFATVFVGARFYSRAVIIKTWGADDWWILVSWSIGGIALTVDNCLLVHNGSGRHAMVLTFPETEKLYTLGFCARVLYQFTLMTTKFAVCAFYFRVFTDRTSKMVIWGMAAFVMAFSIPLLFAITLECRPIRAVWNLPARLTGYCNSDHGALYGSAILNIFADTFLLAFVIPKIVNLRIAKKQKIGLIVVLSLSILIILAAIIRLVRVVRIVNSPDVPWDSYDVDIWAAVEVSTGIFCVSAPAVKPLIRQIAPGLLSSVGDSNAANTFITNSRKYGGGTAISRVRGEGNKGFELSSQTNLGFPPKVEGVGNKSWINFETKASRESDEGASGDAESERAIVEKEVRDGETRKTVRVMVKGVKRDQENEVGGFECV